MPHPALVGVARRSIGIFGEPAQYVKADGQAILLKAIFQAAYAEVDAAGVPISDRNPTAWILESQVGVPDIRDVLEVGGQSWRIREIQPDGYGISKLTLGRL